jgi:hypothetical protein
MNSKAQVIGQVFIFIIAGIVFVLILGYGYKAIMGFIEKGEKVELIDFRNELDSAITVIKRDYGSVQRVDLRIPPNIKEVCFVTSNPDDIKSSAWQDNLKQKSQMMYDSWLMGSGKNVFLLPKRTDDLQIGDILIDPEGFLCAPVSGSKVSLRVEGTGNRAKISEWPQLEGK